VKHHLPPLDSLKAFESAARHMSFSLAAEELCLSKGAISYQIRKLEEHIQCTLFRRAVRQVYLTDAGQALLQTTKQLFNELDESLQLLHGENRQTGVTIAISTYVAARWLSPRISEFIERHPDIVVRLLHSVNATDFKLADVDIAIRWSRCDGEADQGQFNQNPTQLFPVAAPKLMQSLGIGLTAPLDISALADGPLGSVQLLCEDRHLDLWNEWYSVAQPGSALLNPRRIISDANVRAQAAIDGQGILLADGLMNTEIENGSLIKLFDEYLDGYGYSIQSSASRILSDQATMLKHWLTTYDVEFDSVRDSRDVRAS